MSEKLTIWEYLYLQFIKFEEQIHLPKKGFIGQDVVMPLLDNQVTLTNLHIASYGGATYASDASDFITL